MDLFFVAIDFLLQTAASIGAALGDVEDRLMGR